MSEALKKLQSDVVAAMKAGDRTRLDVLRQFVNRVKMTAKNDKNREPRDEDVVTAGLKIVKEANETREIYLTKGVSTELQDSEIRIVSEYLPQKMDTDKLRSILNNLMASAPEGKAAKGYLMKNLNTDYRGQYDPQDANAIVAELVG